MHTVHHMRALLNDAAAADDDLSTTERAQLNALLAKERAALAKRTRSARAAEQPEIKAREGAVARGLSRAAGWLKPIAACAASRPRADAPPALKRARHAVNDCCRAGCVRPCMHACT